MAFEWVPPYLPFEHSRCQKTMEDMLLQYTREWDFCTYCVSIEISFSLTLKHTNTHSHKRYLVACLWSWDQPVSWVQCQLFCICWAYTWHDSGLAGICTKSDHPSYGMPANCITMQVFRDIATVTVQLMDWCCNCSNRITGPVKSEIHQRCLHSDVLQQCAVWTMES